MPCDYEKFCSDRGELVDAQMLVQTIPTNNSVNLNIVLIHCHQISPKLLSVFQSQARTSYGRNKSQAYFTTFPYFQRMMSQLQLALEHQQPTQGLSVSNSGGTLLSSKGFVEFETPSIMNTGALEELDIKLLVYVGSLAISLKETFRFTPVPVGRAILTGVQPQAIFPGVLSSITVRLSNFPLIPVLSDVSQIQAVFDSNHTLRHRSCHRLMMQLSQHLSSETRPVLEFAGILQVPWRSSSHRRSDGCPRASNTNSEVLLSRESCRQKIKSPCDSKVFATPAWRRRFTGRLGWCGFAC